MKNLFFTICFLISGFVIHAQSIAIDFESDYPGVIAKYGDTQVMPEIRALETVANPFKTGSNTSEKVLMYSVAKMRWGGVKFKFVNPMTVEEFNEKYSNVKFKLYQEATCPASVAQVIKIKPLGSWDAQHDGTSSPTTPNPLSAENAVEVLYVGSSDVEQAKAYYHKTGQWLEFEYNATLTTPDAVNYPGGKVYGLAIQPTHGAAGNDVGGAGYVCYIDDIVLGNKSTTGIRKIAALEGLSVKVQGDAVHVNVEYTNDVRIAIYNTIGQKVADICNQSLKAGDHTFPLNLDTKGIYILKATLKNGASSSVKFLK